jgi:hypothetical protein
MTQLNNGLLNIQMIMNKWNVNTKRNINKLKINNNNCKINLRILLKIFHE